jgi:hypothetical protein
MLLTKGRRESGLTPHPAPLKKGVGMRKTVLLLASMALAMLHAELARRERDEAIAQLRLTRIDSLG